ncbi:hypothetical protein MP478_12095 [Chryseobacterium sp. WG14]|uniref:hypothetical protein n=1 Tax=unclassified Chryseobacterium TaxID=2593645 RepID=UPI00211DC2E2|nr:MULTISPECIES: hypothetical protein [unclassified Chryseobacterium]MCQ9634772.1 hypothetical protein [Chryseobacterium sp. WG23]MCQ9640120.1 hypothetical protein [Chryseobacterium sp. WG14]
MKKIIIISCIILAAVFFNYPVFDSEGISYIIILCCFVVITFSTAKIYNPDKEDYQSVEKEMDCLLQYGGTFNQDDSMKINLGNCDKKCQEIYYPQPYFKIKSGFVYPKKAFEINDILAYRLITSTWKSIE